MTHDICYLIYDYDKYMTVNAGENVLNKSTNSLLVEVQICTDIMVFSMQVLTKGHVTNMPLLSL